MMGPHRSARWPEFSSEDMATMEAIHPYIDAAFQRVNLLQSQRCAQRGIEELISLLPLPAILVDWQLKPLLHNTAGRESAARWLGAEPHHRRSPDAFEIPADLLAAIAEMKENWTAALRVGLPDPAVFLERTIVHERQPELRALISIKALRSPYVGKPSFMIRFETDVHSATGKLAALARLSTRERDLALMVSEGMSNQEIADALGRSLNTVKSELHSVFKKLEIPSRSRLMALLR